MVHMLFLRTSKLISATTTQLVKQFPLFALEMITQLVVLLLLLEPLETASSTPDGQLLPVSSATAKSFDSRPPALAVDGYPNTFYHSGNPTLPQWLKLQLEEPAFVSRVVIINR